jgi:hypothetical protein
MSASLLIHVPFVGYEIFEAPCVHFERYFDHESDQKTPFKVLGFAEYRKNYVQEYDKVEK